MSYCINPLCAHRQNAENVETCATCGTPLLINNRIRLIKPLRPLTDDPRSYFDVFEIEDFGTQLNPVRKLRVVKVLKWNSSKLREMIERESITLRRIRHQNIPKSSINDFFTFVPNNSPLELRCLIMDKIEGQNLDEWINKHERISQTTALDWMKQLVEILDVVHHTEFFHRDIKPSNIILQPDGQLALIDFGTARRVTDTYLAKVSGSGGTSKRVGNYEITSIVTACYTPSEQMNGKAVPQSDFYALGRTFINLVTGISLLDLPTDETTGSLVWRDKAPQIDKPFADFLDELMAPLPGQRPATTEVILQRLEKLPQQIKNYRITNSKIFKFSKYTLMSLLFVGGVFLSIPLVANHLVAQGKKLEVIHNSQKAQDFFNWAIIINPRAKLAISNFYFEKGLRSTKSLDSAKRYYELAIKYNELNLETYNNLAIVCQQLQQNKCVIDNYQKAIKLNPNNWEGYYGLGTFYDEQGQYDLAEQQYGLAIQKNPRAILAINNLSRLKIINGDYNTAIYLALKGLNQAKSSELQAVLYKNLGWAKFEQKEYLEAKKYLEKAKELDIQRTAIHCLLAQVEETLGDADNSWLSWEACLLTQSTDPDVFGWRSEVLQRIRLKAPAHLKRN
jgi:serine/threonine protein kinase